MNSTESHLLHGMIDRATDREHLKELLVVLLGLMAPKQSTDPGDETGESCRPAPRTASRESVWRSCGRRPGRQ